MSLTQSTKTPPRSFETSIDIPNDARSVTAFKESANELKLIIQEFVSGPGLVLLIVRYEDPADLIRLGCMYQTNLNKA